MYTNIFIYAVIASIALGIGLYLAVQFLNIFKYSRKKYRQKEAESIQKYNERESERIQRKYEKEKLHQNTRETLNKIYHDEEEEDDTNDTLIIKPTPKKEPKSVSLKDRIYKKESWTSFNCDMDNINHDNLVASIAKNQDESYQFIGHNLELQRLQQQNNMPNT